MLYLQCHKIPLGRAENSPSAGAEAVLLAESLHVKTWEKCSHPITFLLQGTGRIS
jgi:hypothetical protein